MLKWNFTFFICSDCLPDRLRYFRAFYFNPDAEKKSAALVKTLEGNNKNQVEINKPVLNHVDPSYIRKYPIAMKALKEVLDTQEGKEEFIEMASRYQLKEENPRLLKMALAESNNHLRRRAAETLLKQGGLLW